MKNLIAASVLGLLIGFVLAPASGRAAQPVPAAPADTITSSSAAPVANATTSTAGGPNALSVEPHVGPPPNVVRFNGLLQTWFVNDTTLVTPGNPNFVLRRAEIRASGEIQPGIRWFVMVDPAKLVNANGTANQDGRILQDLGVGLMLLPGLELSAGQFKTQTTAEGLERSAELLLPERSIVGRTYGDRREPGAVLAYNRGYAHASVMVSNGLGANTHDTDGAKRLSARASYDFFEGMLQAGAFTQAQNFGYASGSHGLSLRLTWESLTVSTEGVLASEQAASGATAAADGMHLTAAWSLSETQRERLAGLVRVELDESLAALG
jgi:hypothetical protein